MRAILIAILLFGCGLPEKEDYKKEKPPTPEQLAAAAPKPPPKKVLTQADLGTCHVTASGAISADQTSPGGRTATNVSYWYSPEEQKSMMGVDGFVVNCVGADVSFRLVPAGKAMPFSPKNYTFEKGKPGDAGVVVAFGKKTLDGATGTVN